MGRYLVLGLGKSGLAIARFLKDRGDKVDAFDDSPQKLASVSARLHLGSYDPDLKDYKVLITSPGVANTHPLICQAKSQGIEVVGEAGFILRECQRGVLAVTGTNGKTTTTLMVAYMLNAMGIKAEAMGNIGDAISEKLPTMDPAICPVVELSSYQIETLNCPVVDAAVVLNITEDHLDRYSSFEEYAKAKLRIAQSMAPEGVLYLQADVVDRFGHLLAPISYRTFGVECKADVSIAGGKLWVGPNPIAELPAEFSGMGPHDLENLLAAYCLISSKRFYGEQVLRAAIGFSKPAHRLQWVSSSNGVAYYNDSKGTNLAAVAAAVHSMKGPVVLIAGGQHKGASYSPWIKEFKGFVREIYAIGQAAEIIASELGPFFKVHVCSTLSEAVQSASRSARSGDCVLLSPGCASFDMFSNYEQRGEKFQDLVLSLCS